MQHNLRTEKVIAASSRTWKERTDGNVSTEWARGL